MRMIRMLIAVAALAVLAVTIWFATRVPPLTIQGEVSANRVDISPRVAGRVAKLNADVGDKVEAQATIAELDSPQLQALRVAAEAALGVAQADLARVNSTRPEVIKARRAEMDAAQADVVLNQEAYDRTAQLVKSGSAPQARLDEATRNLEASIRKREAAEANLELATAGASPEERSLAAAQVEQAKAALEQRKVDVAELTIRAPIGAEVTSRVAELGENFGAGAPLFSLIDMNDPWITFNLREDLLKGLKVGDTFEVTIPAIGSGPLQVRVTTINVQGQFATWRATRATGDFDLRTFEVRAKPVQPIDGLRPGMSVIASWVRP